MKLIQIKPLSKKIFTKVSDNIPYGNWRIDRTGYVFWRKYVGRKEGKDIYTKIYLHRVVAGAVGKQIVDHINGDKLDNRKDNLRICSQSFNCFNSKLSKNNTSGFRGVSWLKCSGKWNPTITKDRKKIHLGLFESKEDAIRARIEAEKKYFPDFLYSR